MPTVTANAAATHGSHHVARCYALFAYEALRSGPIFTSLHETGAMVAEEVNWVRTSQAHRHWIPGPVLESRLLVGLSAAASLGLVQMRLTPQPGDSATYCVCWERKAQPV